MSRAPVTYNASRDSRMGGFGAHFGVTAKDRLGPPFSIPPIKRAAYRILLFYPQAEACPNTSPQLKPNQALSSVSGECVMR